MKTKINAAALLLAMGLLPLGAQAQKKINVENAEPRSILFVSIDNTGDEIIRILNETQLPRFHEPKAPRFLLTDQKGKFALGIGGYVRATAEYDFNGMVNNVDFLPALISNGKTNFARNQFQMDISTSTLFLKLVGHTRTLGDFVVYTAGNFRGPGKTLRLQNAYASFLGFTAGYSYGNFMDQAALPPTIDWAGPNGSAFYRTTQLSYLCNRVKNWKFGAGIEMPAVDGTLTPAFAISTQRMPDFTSSVQYNWNKNSHLRLAGIVRSMTYSSANVQKAYATTGYGVQASTTFNLGKKWQVYGQMNYGKGIAQYLNDLSTLNVDLVPNPEDKDRMQTLPMMGGYAGLQYNLCSKVLVSGTYSLSRLYSEKDYPSEVPGMYRKGQYLVANLFWNVSSNMQVGVEYLRGWNTDFKDHTDKANRMNMLVQYSF
ncbi:MAG: DcaP family trimeric outer membrane transporter [Bacteroides sp.]